MKKRLIAGAISLAASLGASPAFAGGFGLSAQSAESLGLAMAGAQADRGSPSAAYYNPAAIVGVKSVEASLSLFGVFVDSQYDSAKATLIGGVPVSGATSGESAIGNGLVPDAVFAARLTDRMYFALALNAPFGFSSEYADDSVIRYHGTSSKVLSAALTPIIGVAITPNWSVAAGPRIQYMDVDLDGFIDAAGIAAASMLPGFIPGTDDIFIELDADDYGFGYVFGVQGRIGPSLFVGASYTSKIEHDFAGSANFTLGDSVAGQALSGFGLFQDTGISAPVTTPASVQVGAEYKYLPFVSFLASVVWTQWSDFTGIAIAFDNPAQPPEIVTQNWRDTWAISLGAEADILPTTTLRIGVMAEQTPVVDEFASPRIPDANRIWLAAGASQKLGPRAEFHVGASYVVIGDRPIDQPLSLPENLFRGGVQTEVTPDSVVLSAGVDFRF